MKDLTWDMIQVGKVLRHFKGGEYKVVALALDTDNLMPRVIYRGNHELGRTFDRIRPQFLEVVTWPDGVIRTRFVLLESEVTDPEGGDLNVELPSQGR